jgi:hypothetical protein
MSELVSVIITCYNDGQYLQEAIDSVLAQTWPNFEIIVVDDGSTDRFTQQVLQNLHHERIRVFHKENGHLSSARNFGVIRSSGNFFIPLDADDKLHPTFIERAYHILSTDPGIAAVSSWAQHFGVKSDVKVLEGGGLINFLRYNNCVACALIRKEVWEQNHGYDERMKDGFEDWEFWINTTKKGWRVFVIPEPLFYYRIKKQSMVTDTVTKRPEIYNFIIYKHRDVYDRYYPQIIFQLEKDLISISDNYRKSRSYRIGSTLLIMPRLITKVVNRIRDWWVRAIKKFVMLLVRFCLGRSRIMDSLIQRVVKSPRLIDYFIGFVSFLYRMSYPYGEYCDYIVSQFRTAYKNQYKQPLIRKTIVSPNISMYVDLTGRLGSYLYFYKNHPEKITRQYIVDHVTCGDTFIEIGANYGYFSLLAALTAGPIGQVFCFESRPQLCRIIRESSYSNAFNNLLTVENCIVTDSMGLSSAEEIVHDSNSSAASTPDDSCIVQQAYQENDSREFPTIITLDQYFMDKRFTGRVFVKIDMLGTEDRVLAGMEKMLTGNIPYCIILKARNGQDPPCQRLIRSGYMLVMTDIIGENGLGNYIFVRD